MSDYTELPILGDDGGAKHLKNTSISDISLPNQEGNLLRLDRSDTFRMVLYCFPMTGRPDRPLPYNWNNIPGAKGCTLQTCFFRDNYDEIIGLNAVPVGISTQSIDDNKEMSRRLQIPYDVLSDEKLELKHLLNLPTFSIKDKIYLKRLTVIVEKKIIKKVFYPIYPIHNHISDILKWLKEN
jgi:peroxiredoxin